MSEEEDIREDDADYSSAPEAVRAESFPDGNAGLVAPAAVNYAPYPGVAPPVNPQFYPNGYQQVNYRKTNGMAIAGFVLALSQVFLLFFGLPTILAIIFSHIGLAQARQRNENGRPLAITGLILGYLGVLLIVLILLLTVLPAFDNANNSSQNGFDT